jgi:fibronectin-binding autotransporter adhesin
MMVGAGGSAGATTIFASGRETVSGTDAGATLQRQRAGRLRLRPDLITGTQDVKSGGVATGTLDSGTQIVELGGAASRTTVLSGGSEDRLRNGFDVTISAGVQDVFGAASGTVLRGGGVRVHSGASTSAITIFGGSEIVSVGGSDTGAQI